MFTSSRFSLDKTSQNDDSYFGLRIGSILIGFFSILTLVVGIFYLDCSEFLGVQYELSGLDFNNEAFNPRMLIFYIFALVSGLLMYGAATEKSVYIVPWLCCGTSWLVLNFTATIIKIIKIQFDDEQSTTYLTDYISLSTITYAIQLCVFLVVYNYYTRVYKNQSSPTKIQIKKNQLSEDEAYLDQLTIITSD